VMWPVCFLKDDDVSLHEEAALSLLSPVLSCSQVYSCWHHPPRRDLPSPYKYEMWLLSFSLSLSLLFGTYGDPSFESRSRSTV
jgi:hypothetical protein